MVKYCRIWFCYLRPEMSLSVIWLQTLWRKASSHRIESLRKTIRCNYRYKCTQIMRYVQLVFWNPVTLDEHKTKLKSHLLAELACMQFSSKIASSRSVGNGVWFKWRNFSAWASLSIAPSFLGVDFAWKFVGRWKNCVWKAFDWNHQNAKRIFILCTAKLRYFWCVEWHSSDRNTERKPFKSHT